MCIAQWKPRAPTKCVSRGNDDCLLANNEDKMLAILECSLIFQILKCGINMHVRVYAIWYQVQSKGTITLLSVVLVSSES